VEDHQVLNLSAFGDIIENPNKRDEKSGHSYKKTMGPADSTFSSFLTFDRLKEEPKKETATNKENPANLIVHEVLAHTAQIKLLHWQTHSFAEHKALNKLFNSFIDLTDNLVESIMGKYGRPVLSGELGNFTVVDYKNPESPDGLSVFMDKLYSCYSGRCKSCFSTEKDPEILNIIDEIIAIVDKTKYLLSLK
jgi:hypothetical protein